MPHVQLAGDIGRGHGEREGRPLGGFIGLEVAGRLPVRVQAGLCLCRVEVLGELHAGGGGSRGGCWREMNLKKFRGLGSGGK